MPWFYNSYSGELTHADGLDALAYEAALHTGTGWHELNIAGSATEAQAAAEAVKEVPRGAAPTTSLAAGLGNAAGSAISGLSQVGDFFARLEKPNTWLRVAEAAAGFLLAAIGINALLHNPAGKAARVAAKVRP